MRRLGVLMIVGRLFNWSRVLDALPRATRAR